MKGIREIRTRIKGVKNTAQITRAMQLVAASKMKRAQEAALNNRPYTILLAEILTSLVDHLEAMEHPFLEERPAKNRGILVIGTDRGLCGGLNQNLTRRIQALGKEGCSFVAVGKKIAQSIGRLGMPFLAEFKISDPITFHELRVISAFLLQQFREHKIDTVEVLYPKFKNTLVQEPVVERLLPLHNFHDELNAVLKRAGVDPTSRTTDDRYFLLEPSAKELVQRLPEVFFRQTLYHEFLEAKASEQSARMVAMKMASENAQNIINELTLDYNKARQAAITQEIQEIAASQRMLLND